MLKTRRISIVIVCAFLWAASAAEPAWLTGTFRYSQRFVQQDSRPIAVGNQKTTTMLLDRLITPRSKSRWAHVIEHDGAVLVIETGKALNLTIDQPVQFRRSGDKLIVRDQEGKQQKCRIVAQMSLEEARNWGKK